MADVEPVPWDELQPKMQTGDLLLFAGHAFDAKVIEFFTRGPYSHASMIYRADADTPPYMWEEATEYAAKDPITGTVHNGAQLGDVWKVTKEIMGYGNTAYYRQLIWTRPPELNDAVMAVMKELDGRPFGTYHEMELDWAEGHFLERSSGNKHMYCALLVAATYQQVGLLDEAHPSNYYSPASFSAATHDVVLQLGARFGPEIPVTVT